MEEVRRIRKERGLSQQRLSEQAGVDKVTVVHIENGKVSPKVETLEKLAAALGVEVAEFFPKAQSPLFPVARPATPEEQRDAEWVERATLEELHDALDKRLEAIRAHDAQHGTSDLRRVEYPGAPIPRELEHAMRERRWLERRYITVSREIEARVLTPVS